MPSAQSFATIRLHKLLSDRWLCFGSLPFICTGSVHFGSSNKKGDANNYRILQVHDDLIIICVCVYIMIYIYIYIRFETRFVNSYCKHVVKSPYLD